jgi:hypothetical protein
VLIERYVEAGLDLPPPSEPSDGQVVAAVAALFAGLDAPGADLGLRRELAMLLARTAERETGPAQVGAVRELLAVARGAAGEADDAWQAFAVRLRTPVSTDEHGNVIDGPDGKEVPP